MPIYEFVTKDGKARDHWFRMQDRPPLGEWVNVAGERVKRVISLPPESRVYDRSHVSHSLPRKGTGIEKVWHKFDDRGRPVFESDRDIREFKGRAPRYGYDG